MTLKFLVTCWINVLSLMLFFSIYSVLRDAWDGDIVGAVVSACFCLYGVSTLSGFYRDIREWEDDQ